MWGPCLTINYKINMILKYYKIEINHIPQVKSKKIDQDLIYNRNEISYAASSILREFHVTGPVVLYLTISLNRHLYIPRLIRLSEGCQLPSRAGKRLVAFQVHLMHRFKLLGRRRLGN